MQTSTVYGINLTFQRQLKEKKKQKKNLTLKSKFPRFVLLEKVTAIRFYLLKHTRETSV